MKRMHMHVKVESLDHSIAFYSALFGQSPTVKKHDYAKWMVDDPRINFAISLGGNVGLNHLGIQAETSTELEGLYQNLESASIATLKETGAKCCYALSDKHWAQDPNGVVWEMYRTMDAIEVYGEDRGGQATTAATAMVTHETASACGTSCAVSRANEKARLAARVCCG